MRKDALKMEAVIKERSNQEEREQRHKKMVNNFERLTQNMKAHTRFNEKDSQ